MLYSFYSDELTQLFVALKLQRFCFWQTTLFYDLVNCKMVVSRTSQSLVGSFPRSTPERDRERRKRLFQIVDRGNQATSGSELRQVDRYSRGKREVLFLAESTSNLFLFSLNRPGKQQKKSRTRTRVFSGRC